MPSATDIPTSRHRARHLGARFYQGSPCDQHPGQVRYTVNARCVDCAKADRRLTYSTPAAKEKDAERKRAWRAERARLAASSVTDQFADLLG